jgi:hypothetical protein
MKAGTPSFFTCLPTGCKCHLAQLMTMNNPTTIMIALSTVHLPYSYEDEHRCGEQPQHM